MAETDPTARLDALEIRIAYQDQTIEDLNAALIRQGQEIERLRREMRLLEAEMREAMAATPGDPAGEPPPPHY
jgi:SlyX protein